MSFASLADPDLRELAGHVERYRTDPIAFMREILGVRDIWDGMEEIAESVRDNRRTAVAGCHDSCKTFTVAALTWWWVICHQPAKVVLMGPEKVQLRRTLWSDIQRLHEGARIPIGGEMRAEGWELDTETWMLLKTATKDTNDAGSTGMQGFKSPRLLLVFDEAIGINRPFWISARGVLGRPDTRWVAMANPTDPACGFADCWRQPSWSTINISAFDTPNMREGDGANPWTPTNEWLDEQREDYGEDSPFWEARVLGEFPSAAIGTLISRADFERACAREPTPLRPEERQVHVGVDLARQGDDKSCIVVIVNEEIAHIASFQIPDMAELTGVIKQTMHDFGIPRDQAWRVALDCTGGWGYGPHDFLAKEGWKTTDVNFGSNPVDETRFVNRRVEMWSGIRDWLRSTAELGGLSRRWQGILRDDLCDCFVDMGGRKAGHTVMRLEKKADMKKRLGHSPDHGDALALALSFRSAKRGILSPGMWRQRPEQIDNPRIATGEPPKKRRGRKPSFAGGGDGFYD